MSWHLTEDTIRFVYGMNSTIIDSGGSPHVILEDPMTDGELEKFRMNGLRGPERWYTQST